jgi:hypothetical protein
MCQRGSIVRSRNNCVASIILHPSLFAEVLDICSLEIQCHANQPCSFVHSSNDCECPLLAITLVIPRTSTTSGTNPLESFSGALDWLQSESKVIRDSEAPQFQLCVAVLDVRCQCAFEERANVRWASATEHHVQRDVRSTPSYQSKVPSSIFVGKIRT